MSQRGGKREGSGRKKLEIKEQLCLYVEQSTIDFLGGLKPTRDYLYDKLKVFKKQ
jgi:hypothetical protein